MYIAESIFLKKKKKKSYLREDTGFRRGEMLLPLSHFLSTDYKEGQGGLIQMLILHCV